ncbi:MAG: hypothetical protein WA125_08355 [Desulfosporosinus sp.]
MEEEIEIIKQDLFDQGKDLNNVIYSQGIEVFNLFKAGSEAESLLSTRLDSYGDVF